MVSILLGAVVMFVVGAVWFTVLFGKLWSRLMNFGPEAMAKTKAGGMGGKMAMMFFLNLVSGLVLYCLLSQLLVFSYYEFFTILLLVWFGFTLPSLINTYLWEGKPVSLVLVNAGGSLASFIAGSAVVYWSQ
jgi:hypothetical protein